MKNQNIKLSLKQSLIILVAIPFIGFLSTLMIQINSNKKNLSIITIQIENANFVESSAKLISSLQRERGLSATMINGGSVKDKVNSTRKDVDNLYKDTTNKFQTVSFYQKSENSFSSIKPLIEKMRKSVNNKNIGFAETMEGYSSIVKILTTLNTIATSEKTTGGVGKRLSSLNILLDAQEGAGRFRGYASSILTADKAISESIMNIVIFDFNSIIINVNSKGVLLSDKANKTREKLRGSSELNDSKHIFLTLSMKYKEGNFNQNSQNIWNDTTKIISYIEILIEDGFTNIDNVNKTLFIDIKKDLTQIILITVLTAILIIIVSIFVIQYITHRISKVTNRLNEMSGGGGDLTHHLESDINDEIGKLSEAFNSYLISLASLISGIKNTGTDFVSFSSGLKKLITDVNNSKTIVSNSLGNVDNDIHHERESIGLLKKEMDSVDKSSVMLSNAVDEQVTAVEQSSAAVEQMIANINMVTRNVERTAEIVSDLSVSGVQGKKQINIVTKEINNVSELSNSLKSANTLIADIAGRTSLLSMNAAIEAAHAGDAGKGFAVVADEIRKLSESTASQSKGITDNLNLIISAISEAVDSSKKTEGTITLISDKIELVSQNQEQIKNAMFEQNQGSVEILDAITQLKSNSASVDNAVSNLNRAGEKMQEEEEEVYLTIKNVENSVSEMTKAVNDIEKLLSHLTLEEKNNNKLVSELSRSMDQFKVE